MKPVIPGPLAEDVPPAEIPTPLETDSKPAYTVSKILRSHWREGRLEYLVDWEGWPRGTELVRAGDILDPLLIQEYHTKHPNQQDLRSFGPTYSRKGSKAPGVRGLCLTSSTCISWHYNSQDSTDITKMADLLPCSASPDFWVDAGACHQTHS